MSLGEQSFELFFDVVFVSSFTRGHRPTNPYLLIFPTLGKEEFFSYPGRRIHRNHSIPEDLTRYPSIITILVVHKIYLEEEPHYLSVSPRFRCFIAGHPTLE